MEHRRGSLRIRDNDTCVVEGDVVRTKPLPVGWKLVGDRHYFAHMTYICSGVFYCERWSGEANPKDRTLLFKGELDARESPCMINIEAGEYHNFECLVPGVLHCIFASRDPVTHEVCDTPNDWHPASGLYVPGPLPGLTSRTTRQRTEGEA